MTSQIRVDEITNRSGLGTVTIYDNGFEFTGVTTFTEDVDITGGLTIGGALTYEDVTNIDSVGVITARAGIRVTGDVGINRPTPSAALDVESASDQTVLRLRNNGGNNTRLLFSNKAAGLGEIFYQGDFRFVDDENSDAERFRIDSSGNYKLITGSGGTLTFGIANGVGTQIQRLLYDDSDGSLTIGGGTATGYPLKFFTGNDERLRITSAGGVGIGTDTPYVNNSFTSLSIGGSGKYGLIELNKSDGVAGSWIDVYGTNGNGDLRITTAGTSGAITFWTGGSFTEKLRITSSGNVGINETSPAYKLSVKDGDIATLKNVSASGGNAVNMLRFRVENSANTATKATLGGVSAETVSNWGGALTFHTKPANGTPNESVTERLRVTADGNVAIGHNSAPTKLGIRGTSASTDATVQIVGNSVSTLLLGQDAGGGVIRGQGGSNQLKFKVGGSGDDAAATGGIEAA